MRWSIFVLLVLLLFDVWYRAHTFGPTITQVTGWNLWPAAIGPSEPLDCDEAAYAYIGHRLLHSDVIYRDITENKPPLGYWLYALGVATGGYNELSIRLLPLPAIMLTIATLWWIGLKLCGLVTACLAAAIYIPLSTDPYLFGNGSNMEHFMNAFSTVSLAFVILAWERHRRWPLVAAGVCVGAATLVKQVAILTALLYFLALLFLKEAGHREWKSRLADVLALALGLALVLGFAALILIAQGAGESAYADILQYGRALATDTLPEPNAPSGLIRWLTGNADPSGRLPWPFGTTNYLVWWGTGSWPLWLAAVPAVVIMLLDPGARAARRLVAAWTIAAGLQVVLPGLYWQHYYLLPVPGIALVVATVLVDAVVRSVEFIRSSGHSTLRRVLGAATTLAWAAMLVAAIVSTLWIQVGSYLLVPPQELTVRYKGGGQWVALRSLGRELERRARLWSDPRIYVWGWQSPLHFYGKLDSVTRHFFVDNLLRDQAERNHPLIAPRIEEIMRALHERPPAMIFAGYPPFPELRAFLLEHYLPSGLVPTRNGMGLWVDRERFAAFEKF